MNPESVTVQPPSPLVPLYVSRLETPRLMVSVFETYWT